MIYSHDVLPTYVPIIIIIMIAMRGPKQGRSAAAARA
jgi:hypothetical protein